MIDTPTGVDPLDLLWYAQHSAWRSDPDYRREVTRDDPVLFAYTYLHHRLSSDETGGVVSFARHHLDMARVAQAWAERGARRDIWVAPRGGAKSTWALISILWALAHGHRGLALLVGGDERSIGIHMDNLRGELADNQLLLHDFTHLRPYGRNNSSMVRTRGGSAVVMRGIDASSLGIMIESKRPDLLWLDDLEPEEAKHSPELAAKRLQIVQDKVLPMNERAAVCWTGTTTMHGSILHEVVRGVRGEERMPAWVTDGGWKAHVYPAIVTNSNGAEMSYWPARHPLTWLRKIAPTRDGQINYAHRPPVPGGQLWRTDLFRYLPEAVPLEQRAIWVDVAVSGASTKAKHDYTAICVAGRPVGRRDAAVVEYARAWKMTGRQLLKKLHEICELNPEIRTVHVEGNQGGEIWREILSPLPPGVTLEIVHASEHKTARATRALDRYERGMVFHPTRHAELEDQMVRFPNVEHDDLVDAVGSAVLALLP